MRSRSLGYRWSAKRKSDALRKLINGDTTPSALDNAPVSMDELEEWKRNSRIGENGLMIKNLQGRRKP